MSIIPPPEFSPLHCNLPFSFDKITSNKIGTRIYLVEGILKKFSYLLIIPFALVPVFTVSCTSDVSREATDELTEAQRLLERMQ